MNAFVECSVIACSVRLLIDSGGFARYCSARYATPAPRGRQKCVVVVVVVVVVVEAVVVVVVVGNSSSFHPSRRERERERDRERERGVVSVIDGISSPKIVCNCHFAFDAFMAIIGHHR